MGYIVKNCPAKFYSEIDDKQKCWQKWEEKSEYCQDCSDCVIKRITELCNDVLEQETDPLNSSGMSLAQKILQVLEIEEVNE
ncbi:hypothetical protein IKE67_08895 [bacterium]|nr:hypothetical protein [bacterium]